MILQVAFAPLEEDSFVCLAIHISEGLPRTALSSGRTSRTGPPRTSYITVASNLKCLSAVLQMESSLIV